MSLGKIVYDNYNKPTESTDPIEIQRELQKKYIADLIEATERGRKKYPNDFFIHVETKSEQILAKTFRFYFIDRLTCPTPNYDQTVYKYNSALEQIEYLWTIPDRETCFMFRDNVDKIVKEEHQLLKFVLDYDNGELLRLCKRYNNEELLTTELKKE